MWVPNEHGAPIGVSGGPGIHFKTVPLNDQEHSRYSALALNPPLNV